MTIISNVLLSFIQMTEFKHCKTHVLLPRTQQEKEESMQELTEVKKDDGQHNKPVTV